MSPPEDKTIWKELEELSSLDSGGNFWMSECGDSMTTHWIKPNTRYILQFMVSLLPCGNQNSSAEKIHVIIQARLDRYQNSQLHLSRDK